MAPKANIYVLVLIFHLMKKSTSVPLIIFINHKYRLFQNIHVTFLLGEFYRGQGIDVVHDGPAREYLVRLNESKTRIDYRLL